MTSLQIFRRNYHSDLYKYENTEPIAGNYYPITNKVIISDNKTSMAILTERAQGCSSLRDGQIEIMVFLAL
jgi:lysosomal alpha-mannosidase